MSQSKEDIAKALAALAGANVEPSEAPPSAPQEVPTKPQEEVKSESKPSPPQSASPTSSNRPARPETPVNRPANPQAVPQRPASPKPTPTPQVATPASNRPERPLRPVKPTATANQSSGLSSSIDIGPASPNTKSISATDEIRLRSLRSTLALRQLFIPSCLVLGVTLPLLAVVWFVLRATDSAMLVMKLPIWAVAIVAVAGLFFAGLSVLFILSIKTLNDQISELDDKARIA